MKVAAQLAHDPTLVIDPHGRVELVISLARWLEAYVNGDYEGAPA